MYNVNNFRSNSSEKGSNYTRRSQSDVYLTTLEAYSFWSLFSDVRVTDATTHCNNRVTLRPYPRPLASPREPQRRQDRSRRGGDCAEGKRGKTKCAVVLPRCYVGECLRQRL